MGIQGLLKVLKPYTQPVHISKYSGTRIGIDAYCWLHKGAYACSFDLCENGQTSSSMKPCINYCMHRINLLRFHNIIPVVVFDGGRLPSKGATENERQRRRDQNLELARCKLSQGDVNGAVELFQRAVEITPYMAYELIKVLRSEGVEFVVAPYEADAQLAYLSTLSPQKGGIVAVISEDSDLLAYGCDVVIFKMDKYGNGEEIKLSNVMQKKTSSERPSDSLWFGSFTLELFTGMCVLAGCDFLPSVAGIGIKRAHGLVSKYRDLCRVLSSMRFDPKLTVPEGYEVSFKQANAIFSHARVYDGSSEKLSFLKPLLPSEIRVFNGDLDFLGPDLPPYHALSIAQGRLNPISMSAFDEFVDIKIPSTLKIQSHITTTSMQEDEVKEELIISYIADTDVSSSVSDSGGAILHTVTDEIEEKKPILNSIASAKVNSSSSPSSANDASASIQTNKGFLTHLKHLASSHISSKEWSPKLDDIDEERASSRSTTVSLSPPGNKRVSPLPPNNNPFRKQRAADDSLTFVSKRHIVSRDDEGEAEERVIRLQFNSDAFKKVEMSSLGAPLASSHSGSKRLFGRKEEVLPCGMKMLSHGCFVSEIGDQVSIPPQDSHDMEVVQNGSMEEELELMCSSSSLNECVEELNPSCSSLSLNQKKQKQSNHESSCAVRYPKKSLESKKMKSNGKQGRQQTKKSSSMPTGIILTYFQRSNRTNLTNPI